MVKNILMTLKSTLKSILAKAMGNCGTCFVDRNESVENVWRTEKRIERKFADEYGIGKSLMRI